MGQPELEQRLDQPQLRQVKQRITLRCRLTPLPADEVDSYINCRLKTAGYEGKALFEPKAVDKIGLNSQGIPRLINVICDNALLIAYASSKKKVSATMIEEVARDLRLTVPPGAQVTARALDLQEPQSRDAEGHHSKFDRFFGQGENPPELYPKRRVTPVGVGTLLVLLLTTSVGAALYAQQNKNLLPDMAVKVENYFARSEVYLSELGETMGPYLQTTRHYLSDAALDAEDYFRQSKNYLLGLALKAESLITNQWENLKRSDPIPIAEHDQASNQVADFPALQPNDHPAPAAEEPGLITESKETDLNENASSAPDSKTIPNHESPKTPATRMEEQSEAGDPRTKIMEPETALPENKPAPVDRTKKEQPSFLGNFEVVQDSFLRDKPESDASVTILSTGTRIRVESKSGEYLRVRSLDDPQLRGYVHREDAFFERVR
jgi:hypothetical protein